MTQNEAFVGIDVAKHELVIYLHPQGNSWRVENTPTGRDKLVRRLRRLAANHVLRIGFEASGGYERKLAILLERKRLAGYLLDPSRVHSFGRAEGKQAKTDPLDAALIARALAALHGDLTPFRHDPVAERLTERVRLRELVLIQVGQFANQLESMADPAMRQIVTAQVARLKALILRLEGIIAGLIASCPDLARREKLLRSAPGVGPIVAATLLAHMPELGSLSSRQVASLAGLAPFDRQSGTLRKPSRCQGGRPAIRRALYMAALSILRMKSPLANLGKRLKEQGKPAKVAIIATARKLLVALNAMIKQEVAFQPR
jgi:transposase